MTSVTEIYNFWRINARLATAGQPTEDELRAAAAEGYEVVINLALHDDTRYSLDDEEAVVEGAGMQYIHIPVTFEAPQEADLLAFFDAMDAHKDRKVLVHCAANKRVTAFLGLYSVMRQGQAEAAAFETMRSVWQADPVWRRFIASMLDRHAGHPASRNE